MESKNIPAFSWIFGLLLLSGILLLPGLATSALAQTSTVRGTVTDSQEKAIAGASVTLTNQEKNFSRTQTTNVDGGFVFSAVPPGTYRFEAEAGGFKKIVMDEVRALIDTPTDVNVKLEVGNITETLNISAATEAPLNTSDASIGNAFESRRIEQLPLNARNIVGLLSLQPGVTRGGYVNGGRSDQSNITLDGVDVNEQQNGLDVVTDEAFASVLRTTPDSVQEFRVITTNPNAEAGRSSGAQVALVTKSGTNGFHGSLYEFHRNTVTTANDFFNNKAGVERPQLLRNIFGGSIGGPIKKDRAFFFFTYEGFREATATSVTARTVPLPSLGQGIIRYETESGASDPSCPPGTPAGLACLRPAQIEAAYRAANGVSPGINQLAINHLADLARRYQANDTTTGDGINSGGFRFNSKTPTNLDTYISRLDFNLTNRQTLFVRGNYQQDNVTTAQDFPDLLAPRIWSHPKGLAVGHTWTISNLLLNRFNYGYTRAAFTETGDLAENLVDFRFIFDRTATRPLSRITPVHNFVDDVSWVKGNHSLQFGGNVRLIRNVRTSFANSFDFVSTNPSGYDASGAVLLFGDEGAGDPIFPDVAESSLIPLRNALSALIGRFSQADANFAYAQNGDLLPAGSSAERTFATQEYEAYLQDSWRIKPNLTLTYGLRWSTSTPVYEVDGFQVKPDQSLGEFFDLRKGVSDQGTPFNELITLNLAGKANGKPGFYKQDWNNFAPSIALAYSPDLGDNFFGQLFGRNGKSVIRGGFRMTYDRIGSQLAVAFDLNNQLGFASQLSVPANTYNVSDRLAPLFTGPNPDVRSFPLIAGNFVTKLQFPLTQPADEAQRIESSLDDTITTPYNYNINLSYAREIGKGMSFEASYVGRFARNLLAQRDIMHLNNLRDSRSGQTWYQAINQLIDHRYAGTPITSVGPLPFFENVLPGLAAVRNVNGVPTALTATQIAYRRVALSRVGGLNNTDYTFSQLLWDDTPANGGPSIFDNTFFHPQYAALNVWSTVAYSNYNSLQLSVRQRFKNDILFDFNYSYGHSLDNASGLQNDLAFAGASLIYNPLSPDEQYASSDFDVRHIINANWIAGLPFGKGKSFFNGLPAVAEAIVGGWQLTGIFRWNSGFPVAGGTSRPFSFGRWATNWQASPGMVRVRPLSSSPSKNVDGEPNLFSDPEAAFLSFRDPRPGEGGDRNVFRNPGYVSLDLGLYKTFRLPWENHSITFRWEVYNVTNTQRFRTPDGSGFGLSQDPFLLGGTPPESFGKFTETQIPLNEKRAGRVMQFALRYVF